MDCGMLNSSVNAMIREAVDADAVKKGEKGRLSRLQIPAKLLGL